MAKDYDYPSYDAGGRVKKYKEGGKTEKEKTDKELMKLMTKPSGLAKWKIDVERPRIYDPKLPKPGDKPKWKKPEKPSPKGPRKVTPYSKKKKK
jgi:hypothetical protein